MTTLVYELVSANPYDTFERAEPWRGELAGWRCFLDEGRLTATSDDPLESSAAAGARLDAALRAWEAVAYLRAQYEIRFRSLDESATSGGAAQEPQREHVFRRVSDEYPAPDPAFARTPLAEQLLETNRLFAERRKDLPTAIRELVATLDASLPETGARSLEDAYNIDPDVVATLAELAGRGSAEAGKQAAYRGPEWQWMQEALRLLTLQAGRRAGSPPVARLSAEDFRARL